MNEEAATRGEGTDPLIGRVLDERYRIEEALGEGGIGRVYKARHLILGRHVALKVLLAQYESIPVLKERFRREAEALAALSHPNIVTVTDFGVADRMPYLVMDLLEGQDLAALVDRELLEPKRAFLIVRQVLVALSYAHSRGLVHRDLKPHNVFVRALGGGTDHVEVLDFGLARFVGDSAPRGPKLTSVGALIGTPAYMAPEQASGEAVDARADLYATGLVLFEALTGRKPFEHSEPGAMLRAHLLHPPPKLVHADPGLNSAAALDAWIERALAKNPADRFQSADEMLSALDALGPAAATRVGPRPPRDHPVRTVDPTQAAGEVRPSAPEVSRGSELRESAASVHLPRARLPLVLGVGCAGGLVLVALFLAALWFWNKEAADASPPTPPPVSAREPPGPSPTAPPPVQPVPPRP